MIIIRGELRASLRIQSRCEFNPPKISTQHGEIKTVPAALHADRFERSGERRYSFSGARLNVFEFFELRKKEGTADGHVLGAITGAGRRDTEGQIVPGLVFLQISCPAVSIPFDSHELRVRRQEGQPEPFVLLSQFGQRWVRERRLWWLRAGPGSGEQQNH
ncbi:hypothetical protein R5W24_004538 [Gemmata sp. JC717]|uniref:hypothetical protein n=1 Tax=Gemmata algarum TaxID=2975278 RepID=UPI0021BADDAE|nr:hypothetical protein [Gemmata algarum]MDY3555395.1 hypothetical protein [Gemmata algarum]